MATKTILTMDQFLAFPEREEDGTHYELSEGELVKLPPPEYRHGAIAGKVARLLINALSEEEYVIATKDAGFLLDPNPEAATVRGADIAVNLRSDFREGLPTGWFHGAPLLAVEIVSPGNTAKDMQLKVKQYLRARAREVWLVYPDTRTVYVYSAGRRDPHVFEEEDTFTSIIDKEFRVADFFRI